MKNALLFFLFTPFLSGCVSYMPAAVSSTSVGSKYETPVKTVTGTSSAYYVFGLGPNGNDSLNAAIEDAKSQAPSDSITNVFIDRKLTCFPICGFSIFTRISTVIYGTLVKYTKEDGTPAMMQSTDLASAPETSSKEILFNDLKKGDILTIIFKRDLNERKLGIDGEYEFLWMADGYCAMLKPVGGGIFKRKIWCPQAIGSAIRN